MNICFLSREYPPETGWGGIGTYTYYMAHALADLDNKVHVISLGVDRRLDYRDGNVNIHRILVSQQKASWFFPEFRNRLNYSIKIRKELTKIIDRVDVVESPEWWAEGFWYSYKKKKPLVTKLHTPLYLVARNNALKINLDIKLGSFLEKQLVLNSNLVTSPSRSLAKILTKDYSLDSNRIEVVPYPIDFKFFKPAQDELDKKSFVVLYVGRKEVRKGVDVLCRGIADVIKSIPQAKFVFIGEDTETGPDYTSYERYLLNLIPEEAKNSVNFINFIDRAELISYYQKSDICIFPSVYENFPYTCLEAMSLEKPIIASRVGGIPEMISDKKCGILVPPNDPKAISDAIIKLFEDVTLRKKIGRSARDRVIKNYSPEKIAKATLDVYEKVIENSN